jgi:hypothetical protein
VAGHWHGCPAAQPLQALGAERDLRGTRQGMFAKSFCDILRIEINMFVFILLVTCGMFDLLEI